MPILEGSPLKLVMKKTVDLRFLESTIYENVAAQAVVGLHGILKRTGKKGD